MKEQKQVSEFVLKNGISGSSAGAILLMSMRTSGSDDVASSPVGAVCRLADCLGVNIINNPEN